MTEALWQVQEDQRGHWRDFPEGLSAQSEEQFQAWLASSQESDRGFSYVWHNANRTQYTTYVIMFPGNIVANEELASMQQMNLRKRIAAVRV